jgi:type IV pilus assembly protein PilP
MIKNKTVVYVTLLIFFMMILISASGVIGADSKAAGTKAIDKRKTSQYKYNPMGKPDPFRPFIGREAGARKKLKKDLSPSPLLKEDINQFRLVGISGDEQIRRAIVQDAKGKVYPLQTGTYIGMKKGRVLEIRADRVIVEEKSEVRAGKTRNNKITMKLRMEDVEKP